MLIPMLWTTPILAVLALEPPAASAPAPAPTAAPAPYPGAPAYPGAPTYQPPPPGYYPPPNHQPPPPTYDAPPLDDERPEPARKQQGLRGKGMMISGWSIFGGTWLLGMIVGGTYMDQNKPSGFLIGRPLMAPVFGPFVAAGVSGDALASMGFVFLGLAQTTGLALGITGTVLFARDRRARSAVTAHGLHLGRGVHLRPGPRWGGGTLSLHLRF
jgi:hypothetical protein